MSLFCFSSGSFFCVSSSHVFSLPMSYLSLLLYRYCWNILFLIQGLCQNCKMFLICCFYTFSNFPLKYSACIDSFSAQLLDALCRLPLHNVVGLYFSIQSIVSYVLCVQCSIYYGDSPELNSLLLRSIMCLEIY